MQSLIKNIHSKVKTLYQDSAHNTSEPAAVGRW